MNRCDFLAAAAATSLAAAFAPEAFARRLGGTPLALVTADQEALIVAVDLFTGNVVKRIPTLRAPRSIETVSGDTALVAHTTQGVISLVDAATLDVRRVVRGFAEPRYTAAYPSGVYAYVTDSKRGEVVTIDVSRGRVAWRTPVGGPARHVTIAPDGATIWTALGSKAERIAVLDTKDPRRPRLARTIAPPFRAHDVGFAPDGRHVWVTSGDRRAIALYAPDGSDPCG